jgi:regulatory protein
MNNGFISNTLSCQESAVRLLSRRDHGRLELMSKLKVKGYEENDISQAIDYCDRLGYLDDLRFARSVLRQQINKLHGPARIRQELKQKQLAQDIITQVLQECECDWFELAKLAADKKRLNPHSVDQKEKSKLIRFLQYRGFSFDHINEVINDNQF